MTCKKWTALALLTMLLSGVLFPSQAAEVACDDIYCFTQDDFSQQEGLKGVCITGLPEQSAGTVLLGTRVVRNGDILTAQQLSQLTFQPLRTETDVDAVVTYLPIYENRVAPATTMTIAIRGKRDHAPVAEDSAMETYKNLSNSAQLKAFDPEGDQLTYTLIRSPKRGDVVIHSDGSFTYTPKKNKVGTDSFTYTATDPAGNISREATVTVQILKPTAATTYADTLGLSCRFEAEWLRNTGLFTGENIGGQSCFQPEKAVTKGEFVTMLVQVLDIQVDENASYTGFADDVPTWLKPYLAAAMRSGLTAGWPDGNVFGHQKPISGAEAALLLQNALALPVTTAGLDDTGTALQVLAENGILLTANETLNRGQVAQMLYKASRLFSTAPGLQILSRQK